MAEMRESSPKGNSDAPPWCSIVTWSVVTVSFAFAYGQFPLYKGNYNTYLLHGFAWARRGLLAHDWLARTLDPFPVFSALIAIPAALDWRWFFYVGHGVLLGVYLYAAVHIVKGVSGVQRPTSTPLLAFVIALPQVWAGRDAVSYAFNGDWAWCLQAGVAGQYVVGHMFQPSLFGVLCVASLAAFANRRDRTALVVAAAAVLMHFSYLITVLGLISGYSLTRWREMSDTRAALRYFAYGLILCVTVSLPTLRFLPTDAATSAEAARILTDVRLPHHALPERWLSQPCLLWVQCPLVVLGVMVAWRTRLRWAVLMLLALGAGLLVTQILTDSRQLALLFPWRISATLVPVAFSLVVGALSRPLWARPPSRYAVAFGVAVAVLSAGHGYSHTLDELKAYDRDPSVAMLSAARAMATPETLFAIPTNMERFRLETGARVFIDYKAHPYQDVEVIEWDARLSLADELDGEDPLQACAAATRLHERYSVTHFVRPTDSGLVCAHLVTVFEDANFLIQQWL
jgi:hypothetical protein